MKLLVTTDFSKNSKGAIRFALMLAKQVTNVEVLFYHSIYIMKPTSWGDTFYEKYKNDELARLSHDLKKFVNLTLGKEKTSFNKIDFMVENSSSDKHSISAIALDNNIDYICIATQGAGLLRKIVGTYTSYVINSSKIPVLVIPSQYRSKALKKVTYLSDFENPETEIKTVSNFSDMLSAQIGVLHFASKMVNQENFEKTKAIFNNPKLKNIKLNIQFSDIELSLIEKVAKYVDSDKPDLLIMFTKRERSFFESIFMTSKSTELTYSTKVPVLIFSK